MVISPAGARITWQILLKPSLYSLTGTLGCRRTWSGVMRSARRVGCTLMVRIMGVGCGHSYEIS